MVRFRSRATAVVVLSMMATILPAQAVAAGTPVITTRPARLAPHVPRGATALGQVPDAQALQFEIVLAPSHPDQLQALLAGQRDPSSPLYDQYLAPGQFAQMFGPTATQIDTVTAWLHGEGLHDTTVDGSTIEVRTNVGTATRALGVSLERYRTTDHRETFFAREAPLVPSAVAGEISAVLGLSDDSAALPKLDLSPHGAPAGAHAIAHADGLTPCTAATNEAGGSFYTADQVGSIYGVGGLISAGQTGAGTKLALVELAAHAAGDTSAYLTCFGLHNTITTTNVDGGAPVGGNGTLEANIDVEEAVTQSPHTAIVSYEGPNTGQGEYDVYHKIFADDTAQAVSTSWGLCEADSEPSLMNALDALFVQAAAQGQTVAAASGDNGSEDCFGGGGGSQVLAVDSPADDPNVTGVGGTFLLGAGGGANEPVWNNCEGEPSLAQCQTDTGNNEGADGGGLSSQFTRPAWQPASAEGTCSLASCRGVPDVSANAGIGEVFRSGNRWLPVGGTSIAAPKIAAIIADVDTGCLARVGDLAPKLQTLAAGSGYGTALSDVTSGNNDLTLNHGGDYAALVGADLASGLGTPLATGWSCPEITSLSETSGAAGDTVTITGVALANATFKFANTAATVLAQNTTSATVIVPAGSGNAAVRGTDAMGSGRLAPNFAYPGAPTTTIPTTTTTTVPRPPPPPPVNTHVYRTVASDGGIFSFGGAPFYGSTGGIVLNQPIVGMTTDEATGGYWFVARDGGIFGFHAPFYGSAGGTPLTAPVVGMAGTDDGHGYWLATANGAVFAYGDAPDFGSVHPGAPIVGIAETADGNGYWLADSKGDIYNFGDARNFGSTSGTALTQPIVGITADHATGGYWLVATDGGIFGFNAPFFGSTGAIKLNQPIVGLSATANGKGYWMVARDGGIFSFGNAEFSGSMGGSKLNRPMVGMADAQ